LRLVLTAVLVCGAAAIAIAAAAAAPTSVGSAATGAAGRTTVAAPTSRAFVRVNQVGYPSTAAKRAYLMSTSPWPAGSFDVIDAGGLTVLSAPVGPDLGVWSARYPHVYALDFDGVSGPGRYRIVVPAFMDPVPVSPAFAIGDPGAVYGRCLANALKFYQVQRDGTGFVRSPLRTAPAHLNDRHAMTYRTPKVDADGVFRGDLTALGRRIDAVGGWWDAGDYLKFVHATSYTEALLLAGVRDFPAQMGSGSATSDFTAETKFGARWLLRMWDDRRKVFYYQVGIGSGNVHTAGDHDIWRLPQKDDTWRRGDAAYRYIRHRPVFRLGPPGAKISPNLAGRDAAALAEAYEVFRTRDPAIAAAALRAAAHIFELADTRPGRLVTAIPYDYYPETEWRDDLELGATELYRALAAAGALPTGLPHTDPSYYLGVAAHWARAYIDGPNDAADTLNLYDVSGLAHYELWRAIGQAGDPAGLEVGRADLVADLKKALDGAVGHAATDPFQFGFPWNTWDTTAHGAGLVVMASEYDSLTGSADYAAWSSRWLANILGANAWGTSLIVGDGAVFPHCLQHQVANLRGTLTGKPPVLLGAGVEGPNSDQDNSTMPNMRLGPRADAFRQFNGVGAHGAKWRDAVQNYPNTEPAIDLTAPSPLAFSWMAVSD
jgi:endoglucanase